MLKVMISQDLLQCMLRINMILKTLKQHNLKALDFINYAKLSKMQFNYAIKKNDPIYIKGLEDKFREYIKCKITKLEEVLDAK